MQQALSLRMLDTSLELARQQMAALNDPAMAAVGAQAAMQVVEVAAGKVDVQV